MYFQTKLNSIFYSKFKTKFHVYLLIRKNLHFVIPIATKHSPLFIPRGIPTRDHVWPLDLQNIYPKMLLGIFFIPNHVLWPFCGRLNFKTFPGKWRITSCTFQESSVVLKNFLSGDLCLCPGRNRSKVSIRRTKDFGSARDENGRPMNNSDTSVDRHRAVHSLKSKKKYIRKCCI